MNVKIKELINKVGTDVSGKWMGIDNVEKLAELIVEECASELIKWKNEPFPYDPEFGARLIKEHFGVE